MSDRESSKEEDDLRRKIGRMLSAGLVTEVWPRAESSSMVNQIVDRLKTESENQLEAKLVIAGFTDYTVETDGIEQPCETCMYYLVHRQYCDLPELALPVAPQWSCRLWRI